MDVRTARLAMWVAQTNKTKKYVHFGGGPGMRVVPKEALTCRLVRPHAIAREDVYETHWRLHVVCLEGGEDVSDALDQARGYVARRFPCKRLELAKPLRNKAGEGQRHHVVLDLGVWARRRTPSSCGKKLRSRMAASSCMCCKTTDKGARSWIKTATCSLLVSLTNSAPMYRSAKVARLRCVKNKSA